MRNWRWHKGMNLLTRGRTREQDAGIKWGLPYAIVRGQGSAVSPCWHVDTYHLYLIMSAKDRREQASERAACGEKPSPTSLFPSIPPSTVLHVIRGQERGKLNVSVAMEYRSGARPRARRRERNSNSRESRAHSGISIQARLNSRMILPDI